MFRKIFARDTLARGRRHASAPSRRRGEAARHDTDAVGAEKAGNKDGTIPAYTEAHDAAGRLQEGRRHPPDPFASEKPRLVITARTCGSKPTS